MAIRWRRGKYVDLDLNKLVPGEPVVALDNKYVAVCVTPGEVVELASKEYMEEALVTANNYADEAEQYKNDASTYAGNAQTSAAESEERASVSADYSVKAESWAIGGTKTRDGEDTDNSKYYSEQSKEEADRAKTEADRAAAIANVDVATVDRAGIVKPDNNVMTVDADGIISNRFKVFTNVKQLGFESQYGIEGIREICAKMPNNSSIYVREDQFGTEISESPFSGYLIHKFDKGEIWINCISPTSPAIIMYNSSINQMFEFKYMSSANLVNNLLTTESGFALDARQGKALKDEIDSLQNSLTWKRIFMGTAELNVKYTVDSFAGYKEILFMAAIGQIRIPAIMICEESDYSNNYNDYIATFADGYMTIRVSDNGMAFTVIKSTSSYSLRRIYVRR